MQLTQQEIERHLTGSFGHPLYFYEMVDSTNIAAKERAAQGAPQGTAVVSLQQSAGRGTHGRSFYSPPVQGLYISVVLRPKNGAQLATRITAAAAVAVSEAIEDVCGAQVQIKWVNDIYMGGKKICGILAESILSPSGKHAYIVLGMGVNVDTMEFPPELEKIATSLAKQGYCNVNAGKLAARILHHLEIFAEDLEKGSYMRAYRERSCVLGKRILLLGREPHQTARALAIKDDGALVVELDSGQRLTLHSGEVQIREVSQTEPDFIVP